MRTFVSLLLVVLALPLVAGQEPWLLYPAGSPLSHLN